MTGKEMEMEVEVETVIVGIKTVGIKTEVIVGMKTVTEIKKDVTAASGTMGSRPKSTIILEPPHEEASRIDTGTNSAK
jgi:hypothetical protein